MHRFAVHLLLATCLAISCVTPATFAQRNTDTMAERAISEPPAVAVVPDAVSEDKSVNLLQLIWTARWLMLPIILMSVIVVAIGLERLVSLRHSRMMPPVLLDEIDENTGKRGAFNGRHLFDVANDFPSPTASVLKTFLHKVGRPYAEVERAVQRRFPPG